MNLLKERDCYPAHRIYEYIKSLEDALIFFTLNANYSFRQGAIEEANRYKNGFHLTPRIIRILSHAV